jgi:transcriptional regulator with PAS, ATPase and Fis domain
MNLHNNSVSHTAKALNIQVSNLSRKLKELEINK